MKPGDLVEVNFVGVLRNIGYGLDQVEVQMPDGFHENFNVPKGAIKSTVSLDK